MHHRFGQQFLVLAAAIDIGGVEMVIAKVQRLVEQLDLHVVFGRGAIGPRQVHAAKANGVDGAACDRAFGDGNGASPECV